MKLRDVSGERLDVSIAEISSLQEHVGAVFVRETAHVDRPFDRGSIAVQSVAATGIQRDRNDAEVDVRREPPVQPHFRVTCGPALGKGSEVEEAKIVG